MKELVLLNILYCKLCWVHVEVRGALWCSQRCAAVLNSHIRFVSASPCGEDLLLKQHWTTRTFTCLFSSWLFTALVFGRKLSLQSSNSKGKETTATGECRLPVAQSDLGSRETSFYSRMVFGWISRSLEKNNNSFSSRSVVKVVFPATHVPKEVMLLSDCYFFFLMRGEPSGEELKHDVRYLT